MKQKPKLKRNKIIFGIICLFGILILNIGIGANNYNLNTMEISSFYYNQFLTEQVETRINQVIRMSVVQPTDSSFSQSTFNHRTKRMHTKKMKEVVYSSKLETNE